MIARGARRTSPWGPGDALTWLSTAGFGTVGILVGLHEAGRRITVNDQIPAANVTVLGLVMVGVANGIWLFAGRRSLSRRRRELLGGDLPIPPSRRRRSNGDDPTRRATALVATPAMSRYHRPDCLLTIGKAAEEASLPVHQRAGRKPCEVCRP